MRQPLICPQIYIQSAGAIQCFSLPKTQEIRCLNMLSRNAHPLTHRTCSKQYVLIIGEWFCKDCQSCDGAGKAKVSVAHLVYYVLDYFLYYISIRIRFAFELAFLIYSKHHLKQNQKHGKRVYGNLLHFNIFSN